MMEDWTDIIGEELEGIEESLPADDWNVLQQKYAASRKKRDAHVYAWSAGLAGIAASVAMLMFLFRPDAPVVDRSLIADELPPVEEPVSADTVTTDGFADGSAAPAVRSDVSEETVPYAGGGQQATIHVDADDVSDDVLIAENVTEVETSDVSDADDEVVDIVKDTVPVTETLLAFEDLPEERPVRRRRPMSVGLSGSVSDSPIFSAMDEMNPPMGDTSPPDYTGPLDSSLVEQPKQSPAMMRRSGDYNESYKHELPVSVGVSFRFFLSDRFTLNTGLNYTRYVSARCRTYYSGGYEEDSQYAHYLGIPLRLDWMVVNRKYFNMYLGAGMQTDKCVYAKVGDERLRESGILFSVNAATGLQVNPVPKVGIYLEPEVSYALNDGTIQTFRSEEPFVFTVRAGLRFTF